MFGPLNLNPSRISEKNGKKLEKQNFDYNYWAIEAVVSHFAASWVKSRYLTARNSRDDLKKN